MHHPSYPPLKRFQRWSGLLAAGIVSLSIVSAVQVLFASAEADPQADMARAAWPHEAGTCAPGAAASAARPACDDAAPGRPGASRTRSIRL